MRTLFIGQNTIHLESVDSTNSYASEIVRQNAVPDGTLVRTYHQVSGRGQRGNSWQSMPGANLALSFILYPKFLLAKDQFLLTQAVSLAVADLMAETFVGTGAENVSIKWPNDIYFTNQKLAGILIENTLREHSLQSSVVGIGINVNQLEFSELPGAISLALVLGQELNKEQLSERLCELLEPRYLQLKAGQTKRLQEEYLQRMYLKGVEHEYQTAQGSIRGSIEGVDESGKLLVRNTDTADLMRFDLKEISFS